MCEFYKSLLKTTFVLLFLSFSSLSLAQKANDYGGDLSQLEPVKLKSVEISHSKNATYISPGDTVELILKLNIDPGFHAYREQYMLKLLAPSDFYVSEIQVRPEFKFTDPVTKKNKIGTKDYAEIVSLLEIPKNSSGGLHHLNLELTYQACGEDFCLFPKKISIKKDLRVQSGNAENDFLTTALAKGWFSALLLVFFAGVLTSFTPCIFPMIPITLAILGTNGQSRSKIQSFLISVSYVMGIALTYSILGIAAAKTGAMFGSLLGHPVVVGIIAVIFVLMGLSMYGLFEVQVPQFITSRFSKAKTGQGHIGAFLSGLIAGVVASPCVGPVLIGILTYVAQTQNVTTGFILLFIFALGLGQLFIVLGTFNSLLNFLPKSGPWMEKVKFVFGSIMIGMALYYIYPIAHMSLFDGLVATALISISVFLGAFKSLPKNRHTADVVKKGILQIAFVFGFVFTFKALIPAHMANKFFPGIGHSEHNENVAAPAWFNYSDELLEKALQDKKPVIIDFKADWCLACKELENYTFSDPKVLEFGQQFLWLSFDATSASDELVRLQKRYGIGGLPFVVLYNSKGIQMQDLTLTGFEDAVSFLKRMQAAIE